ncbi:hypothetical protein [Antarcticirhabdus aurantiaca]|uniref:Uncharacterized protein n=1 Tax=Antarcticirhabdus aurantiaca TaxID=2606717 RepID=A0ACD4NQZ8_9HYPH|nr:hypothetical protein OXU80_03490 [Jeongeuplla avenae]
MIDDVELPDDEKALKTAVAALIDACGGGKVLASITKNSHQLFSAYAAMACRQHWMPLRMVMRLERYCGQPIVSQWMVDKLKRTEPLDDLSYEDVLKLASETAEAHLTLMNALADKKIDAADRAALRRDLRDCIRIYTYLLAKVEQP